MCERWSVRGSGDARWRVVRTDCTGGHVDGAQRLLHRSYAVHLFHNERWIRVIIDDLLPCDDRCRVLGARSRRNGELWVTLLEKAYAKVYGSYEAIDSGSMSEGMRDLTGAACGDITVDGDSFGAESLEALWSLLQSHTSAGNVVGCARAMAREGHKRSKSGLCVAARIYNGASAFFAPPPTQLRLAIFPSLGPHSRIPSFFGLCESLRASARVSVSSAISSPTLCLNGR